MLYRGILCTFVGTERVSLRIGTPGIKVYPIAA
jgi:hypothetical protein